ncbi:MAG: hypothetical protein KatS3mg110_4509 [Pirellulaceae bacterium]|nr:MAG: hypothetical protein KatS3mg110_4509 [Pirellulaceae bacterium]
MNFKRSCGNAQRYDLVRIPMAAWPVQYGLQTAAELEKKGG